MAAADLKNILITIISLLMVPEMFSPCLVMGLVIQGICSTMSQWHNYDVSKMAVKMAATDMENIEMAITSLFKCLIKFAMHFWSTCRFCPTKTQRVISQWQTMFANAR